MTDLDKALAAARDRLSQYEQTPDDSLEETMAGLDCIESLRDILDAFDAARGQAVAWQVTVVDNTGTHDYAKWAGLQAPPAAAVPRWSRGSVWAMWNCARNNNATIPTEELDAMRDTMLAAALAERNKEGE